MLHLTLTSMIRSAKSSTARGFTLVELLVVIAMIVTLSALVFVGTQNAMVAAKQTKCAGNLRNLGVAFHLYALDHDGLFPETSHTMDLDQTWIYALENYLGTFDETRICPADPKGPERLKAKGTSYVLNSYIFVPEVGPFGDVVGPQLNRYSNLPEPSQTLMAFICSDGTGVGPGNDHTHSQQWRSWGAVCRDISPDRFGGGKADHTKGRSNYLYVDGRVESFRALEIKRKIEAGNNIAKPPGIEGLQ